MTNVNANRLPDQRDRADASQPNGPSERQAAAGRDGTGFRLPPTFPAAPDQKDVSERQAAAQGVSAKAEGIAREWEDHPEPDSREASPHNMKPEEILDRILERVNSPAASRNLGMSVDQARQEWAEARDEVGRMRTQGREMRQEIRQLRTEGREQGEQARNLTEAGDYEGAWRAYQQATRANLSASELEVKVAQLSQERIRMAYKAQALMFRTLGVRADERL